MGSFFPKINHDKIVERFEQDLKGNRRTKDPRFWTITKKNDIGRAIIRFLPNKDVDASPFVTKFVHKYNFNNKFFFAPALTNVGRPDPIVEWCNKQDRDWINRQDIRLWPKKMFISNILVIEDEEKNNEGKVFLVEYGSQVMEILQNKLKPKIKSRAPLFYYDFDKGANFEIILAKDASGYMGWKESQFLEQSSIMEVVDHLKLDPEKIMDSMLDLKDILSTTEYPSYEQLKTDFDAWLETSGILKTLTGDAADRGKSEEGSTHSEAARKEAEKTVEKEAPVEEKKQTFAEKAAAAVKTEEKQAETPKSDAPAASKSDVKDRMKKFIKQD